MKALKFLFGLDGAVSRKAYLKIGVALAALKYAIDATVVFAASGKIWPLWAYLSPALFVRDDVLREVAVRPAPETLLWIMAAYALPFAWIGLTMSVRRAARAGISPWFGLLFLVPGLNWVAIAVLCFVPDKADWTIEETEEVPLPIKTAAMSIAVGIALTMSMVATSVYVLGEYGWSLFIGTPFVVGIVAGFIANRDGKVSVGKTIFAALVAIGMSALATLLFALEGIICIAMAAAPAAIAAIPGSLIGRAIANRRTRKVHHAKEIMLLMACLPLLAGAESMHEANPLFEVSTAVEIDADPMQVWHHVIHFSELDPPAEWVQKTGIAYPIRAKLIGEGVGAVRHCEFSTGPFIEPITVWEPGKKLAFDVESQPEPMREWSPYHAVHPPHIDGYLRSKRGEFRLIALDDGRTRLEGSTWYELDMAPRSYWTLMTDMLIHRIHLRVLEHVKHEAEAEI